MTTTEQKRLNSKLKMRALRAKRKLEGFVAQEESNQELPIYHDKKTCKSCTGKLEISRWRECYTCKPTLDSFVGDEYIYS